MAREPEPMYGNGRPDDVPSWGQCFREALYGQAIMLPVLLIAVYAMVVYLPRYLFIGPPPAIWASWAMLGMMEGMVIFMTSVIVLGRALAVRSWETPKEKAKRERILLATLKRRYDRDPEDLTERLTEVIEMETIRLQGEGRYVITGYADSSALAKAVVKEILQ